VNAREREILLEAAASAHRESDREGNLQAPPSWWDLPADAREELFELQVVTRQLERAADPGGSSATVRAVLVRIFARG
jgi:hypothetical protein